MSTAGGLLLVLAFSVLVILSLPYTHWMAADGGFRETQAKAQINAYLAALECYKSDTGSYPATTQGLEALHIKPENVTKWRGPYVQWEIGSDPFHHPYVYKFPGDHGVKPDIICYGADGRPGGEGLNADIVSWKN